MLTKVLLGCVLVLPASTATAELTPTVWVNLSTVGLEPTEELAVKRAVKALVQDVGAVAVVKAIDGCVDGCAVKKAMEASAQFALLLSVGRAGDIAQVDEKLFNTRGDLLFEGGRVVGSGELESSLLATGTTAAIRREATKGSLVDKSSKGDDKQKVDDKQKADDGQKKSDGTKSDPENGKNGRGGQDNSTLSLGTSGIVVAGAGLVLAVAGGVYAVTQSAVLEDPDSSGVEKEAAVRGNWVGLGVLTAGAIVTVVGAGMLVLGATE